MSNSPLTELKPSAIRLNSKPDCQHCRLHPRDLHWPKIPAPLKLTLRAAVEPTIGIRWPWWIWGGTGCGKTSIALALCDWAWGSWFFSLGELADAHAASKTGGWEVTIPGLIDEEEGHRMLSRTYCLRLADLGKWIARMPLLVIDEVGFSSSYTDNVREALQMALSKRIGRPTILTSNVEAAKVATLFDPATYDRIRAGTMTRVDGGSLR